MYAPIMFLVDAMFAYLDDSAAIFRLAQYADQAGQVEFLVFAAEANAGYLYR